jgi:hypothetical protein
MSTTAPNPAKRSRWSDWKPKARILADSAESEPTKPSKPGFVGFEGATSAQTPEIEAGPDPADWCSKGIAWAEWKAAALNRLFQEQGVTGKPGRITAATVRHGERNAGGNG